MNCMAELWKQEHPGGYGQVPWLTCFRSLPEVVVNKHAVDGRFGRDIQKIVSFFNAKLMISAWEVWTESVQETRDRLVDESTQWQMKRHLEMRSMTCRFRAMLFAKASEFRSRLAAGDLIRLDPGKCMNLHRCLLISRASTGREGIREDDLRRFKDELLVAGRRGSGPAAQVLVRWYQYEWWMDTTDVMAASGDQEAPAGPWVAQALKEQQDADRDMSHGAWDDLAQFSHEGWTSMRALRVRATSMSGKDLVARCGGYYPYFQQESQDYMDEIFCQRPDVYRPWSEHQEVRQLFTEEDPSGRAYQPSLPLSLIHI